MANDIGQVKTPISFGYQDGPRCIIGPIPVAASEVFDTNGGRFVAFDANRRLILAVAATANLWGWALAGSMTVSSVAGGSSFMVDVSPLAVYCIPANAAVTIANRGLSYDLVVASNVQTVDVGAQATKVVTVVDIDITNQLVYVRLNSATQYV